MSSWRTPRARGAGDALISIIITIIVIIIITTIITIIIIIITITIIIIITIITIITIMLWVLAAGVLNFRAERVRALASKIQYGTLHRGPNLR